MSEEQREAIIEAFIAFIPTYFDTLAGFKKGWNDRTRGIPMVMEPYDQWDTSKLPKYWEQYMEDYTRGYAACDARVLEVEENLAKGGHHVISYM